MGTAPWGGSGAPARRAPPWTCRHVIPSHRLTVSPRQAVTCSRRGSGRVTLAMADIQQRLAGVSDSRGRIVWIFVGAVLLPSIALSVLSFNAVPKQAENLKISLLKQAEQLLYYAEQDLEQSTRKRALEAARAVGPG